MPWGLKWWLGINGSENSCMKKQMSLKSIWFTMICFTDVNISLVQGHYPSECAFSCFPEKCKRPGD